MTGNSNKTETNILITNLTAGVLYEITVTAVAGDNYTEGAGVSVPQYTSKLEAEFSLQYDLTHLI